MPITQATLESVLQLTGKQALDTDTHQTLAKPVRKQRRKAFTQAEIAQLVADYGAGESVDDLTARYRCHRGTILKYTAEAGVRRPHRGDIGALQAAETLRLYNEGMSHSQIATEMGVTYRTVFRRLERAREIR